MARLPVPGSDSGSWGAILNDFLTSAHNTDGSLKDTGILAQKYVKPSSGIPKTDLAASVQTSLDNADTVTAGAVISVAGRTGVVTLAESDITNLTTDLNAKYVFPIAGIPKSDLTLAVQSSLDLADSALQIAPVTSVAGRTGAITLAESDITNLVTDLAAKVSTTSGGKETYFGIGNSGSSKQVDLANGNHQSITLTANCTLTATGFTNGVSCSILLEVIQDGTGGWTLTLPAGWALATDGEATINPSANGKTLISGISRDGGTTVYASIAGWWT